MTILYTIGIESAKRMIEFGELEEIQQLEKYNFLEITVDFDKNTVSVWGVENGRAEMLDDHAYVGIDSLEVECEKKEVCDLYVSNVEIAIYLETFGVQYEWALNATDEWRTPEEEEEAIDEKVFWEAIDGIKTAYKISREEN